MGVCALSRVKGGVERCGVCHACPVVRGRRGLLVACVGVCGLRFLGVAGGYWRVVGEGLFLPPFFVAAGVPLDRGSERWRRGASV